MQDILTCAMGLDVHRDIIVACLVNGAVDAEPEAETRTFSTLIPEMQKLRDWVIEAECRNVAMESTGIYWQPIYGRSCAYQHFRCCRDSIPPRSRCAGNPGMNSYPCQFQQ